MEKLKNKIFTRSSGIRHLIMVPLTVLVLAWFYVAIALITKDWGWITGGELEGKFFAAAGMLGAALGLAAGLAAAVYWNARVWMLPCLLKSVLFLIGAIPLVNRLISEDKRSGWFDSINKVAAPSHEGFWTYDEDLGWEYDDGSIPMFIAVPLGIIFALLKGIFKSLINLVAAIAIPVLSPAVILLGLWGLDSLSKVSTPAVVIIGLVFVAGTVLVYIVHPIFSLKKPKTEVKTEKKVETNVEK